jgi:hypothetical protein
LRPCVAARAAPQPCSSSSSTQAPRARAQALPLPLPLPLQPCAACCTRCPTQERAELCRALLYAVVLAPEPLQPATLAELLQLLEALSARAKAAGGLAGAVLSCGDLAFRGWPACANHRVWRCAVCCVPPPPRRWCAAPAAAAGHQCAARCGGRAVHGPRRGRPQHAPWGHAAAAEGTGAAAAG